MNAYSETDESVSATYRRIHGNGEQTHIAILSAGESFVAVAYDVDPRNYDPVDADCIAFGPTREGVQERANRWMEQHPKGVLGDENPGGEGRMMGLLRKLNSYGNNLTEQPDTESE